MPKDNRETKIEDFFRARGFFHVDEHGEEYFYDPNNKSRLMPSHVYFFYPMDKDFDLFREHVIEVMAGYHAEGYMFFGYFTFKTLCGIKGTTQIIDDQWLLAAIESATWVLNAKKQKRVLEGEKGCTT